MQRRYGTLGAISVVYKIVGILAFAAGILLLFAVILNAGSYNRYSYNSYTYNSMLGVGGSLGALLPGLAVMFIGLVNYGVGQLIDLLRDMELNTRVQADAAIETVRVMEMLVGQMQTNQRLPANPYMPSPDSSIASRVSGLAENRSTGYTY